jgi:hypothetical protein
MKTGGKEWSGQQARDQEARLTDLAAEAAELKAAGLWLSGHRTLLETVGLHEDERKLVGCLGWLLQPEGYHGLGNLVVKGLLDRLGIEYEPTATVRVRTEEALRDTDGALTRADLVLRVGKRCVLVEAKVNAGEHNAQCDRLARLWAHENPTLVFLTPDGKQPQDAPCSGGRWTPLSWTQIAAIIARAAGPRPGSPGVHELLQTLRLFQADEGVAPVTLDEKTRFYLRHRELIDDWYALRKGAVSLVESTIRQGTANLELPSYPDVERHWVEDVSGSYPTFELRRPNWQTSDNRVAIALQWAHGTLLGSGKNGLPYVGIRVQGTKAADPSMVALQKKVAGHANDLRWPNSQLNKGWMWWGYVELLGEADDLESFTGGCRAALEEAWKRLSGPLDEFFAGG